jgi:MSHA biogenesis protein MshN
VAPVRQQGWWMLVLTLLCTLALGILGWRTWIFWQQSQRASCQRRRSRPPHRPCGGAIRAPGGGGHHAGGLLCRASGKVPAASAESTAASGPLRSRAGSGR